MFNKILTIFGVLLLLSGNIYAQTPKYLISGRVKITDESPEGTAISVEKDGKRIGSQTLKRNGRFEFELDYQSKYLLSF